MSGSKEIFKTLTKPSSKWSGYFDVYDRHLNKFKDQKPKVLEIGVQGGGSIEMWHKMFGKGTKVIGIDVDEGCLALKYEGDTEIVLGDQANNLFWDNFLTQHSGFDIIIDDGGHHMDQQSVSLFRLFPYLNNGGVYIVEDTHTSYWKSYNSFYDNPMSFMSRAKQLADLLNQQHFEEQPIPQKFLDTFKDLYSVSFYNSMVVLEKKATEPFYIVNTV